MPLRIGSVPYLNAKPLVEWFHSENCDADVEIIYAVPSKLAQMLRAGEIDVCNCSIFEAIRAPGLTILPGSSISSDGPVKSVRLFYTRPLRELRTVGLDTSSLTSSALVRIVLAEQYSSQPEYRNMARNLENMLEVCDAGLLIGDLKLFDLHTGTSILDLGEEWQIMCGLPFVYAAWQTPLERATVEMADLLQRAKDWGVARLDQLAHKWSQKMDLPVERCLDYFVNCMQYELTPRHLQGLQLFQNKCAAHGLVKSVTALNSLSTSSTVL